jgi:hypothetical protein
MYGSINGASTLIFVGPYRKRTKNQLVVPILKILGLWKSAYVAPNLASSTVQSINPSSVSYIK